VRNNLRFVVTLAGAMLALAAGAYIGIVYTRETRSPQPLAHDTITRLFATRLNDSGGKPQYFAQWREKTLVINFWASWCSPCREEIPTFSRLQTKNAANGVQFVGISLDSAGNVTNFTRQIPVTYPLLIADSKSTELMRQLGNSRLALPYTVVLDASGEVRLTHLGRISEQELDAQLQRIARR
jgi:thiol-disulfide isomerase/thioredoxin